MGDANVTVANFTVAGGVKIDIEAGSTSSSTARHNAGDIDVELHLTFNGSLDNTGTIEGLTDGLTIDGTMTGSFVNSGTIEASADLTISASVTGNFTVRANKDKLKPSTAKLGRFHYHRRRIRSAAICRSRTEPSSKPATT